MVKMSVLLLGATGFVGQNVSHVFDKEKITYTQASRSTGVDLRDAIQVAQLLESTMPEYIVNCAAHVGSLNYVTMQAADVIVDNAEMVLALYKALALTKSKAIVINPLANCAYPGHLEIYSEDQLWSGPVHRSVLSYGSTRRHMLAVSECFSMQHGIRTITLLVPNMYGPHDSTDPNKAHAMNALVAKFIKAQKENTGKVGIWGTGIAIREWLLAKDFGRVIAEIVRNPGLLGLDEPTNIAQNYGLSVREIVSLIGKQINFQGAVEYDHSKPDGAPKKVMSDTRFRKVMKEFEFTEMKIGIQDTIDYYSSAYPF
jgi:GDP-L-fucose synthase